MASVKDLENVFGREERLTPGAVRQLTRLLQEGDILPRARQGVSRGPLPELTARHCAAWLVGLAVTRRAGLRRNVGDAAARVKRFLELVQWTDDTSLGIDPGDAALQERITEEVSDVLKPRQSTPIGRPKLIARSALPMALRNRPASPRG